MKIKENARYSSYIKKNTECNLETSCKKCTQYKLHKNRNTTSREEYQNDVQLAMNDEDCIYFSADLPKVIMLPRMDQLKNATAYDCTY